MQRTRVRFHCDACGADAPKWVGRCAECGGWGTVVETAPDLVTRTAARATTSAVGGAAPVPLASLDTTGAQRTATGLEELDRVLAGGLVAGSVTLLGGEPGVGKSTLVLQAAASLAGRGHRVLLVAAEESAEQVRLRAERLGALPDELLVVADTSVPNVLAHAQAVKPTLLVVDSIQTVHDPELDGVPGSVTQVRDCATAFVRLAKERGVAVLLIGHVTKDGSLAGPRVLEHVVDTVLAFEGDRHHALRTLRAVKHRFGATGELGIFEMAGDGLRGVADASAMLLTDRRAGAAGSVVVPVMEASRPLLVEVQSLVAETNATIPRRQAHALDSGRFAMVVALLQRRCGAAELARHDIFASVVGGVRCFDPGADLGLALAIASAWVDVPVPPQTVVIGEVGLGGEVRSVAAIERRLLEAARIGFLQAIVPQSAPEVAGIDLVRVGDLTAAMGAALAVPAEP